MVSPINLRHEEIVEALDRLENKVGEVYVTHFESPVEDFSEKHAAIYYKSLERIAAMISDMMLEVS